MQETHVNTALDKGSPLLTVGEPLIDAVVLDRPNRFTVIADISGEEVRCHLHDPGRLKEVIFPGNRIRLRERMGEKTTHSVVCADESGEWVLLDSRYHPAIARSFLPEDAESEVKVGNRRLDFRCGNEYIEVKGCTLKIGETVKFPDAPSIRAAEHLKLLGDLRKEGNRASVMFLILRQGARCFAPNTETDPVFSEALLNAIEAGVIPYFMSMHFDGKSVLYDGQIQLCKGII